MSKLMTKEYAHLLAEVKERVRAAQYAAFRAVNKELVALYWDIGRMIFKRQVTGMHGDAVVEQLASDLRMEFPGVGGFSRRNVFYMREFHRIPRSTKSATTGCTNRVDTESNRSPALSRSVGT